MDVYIVMDMEGISGISGETIVRVGHEEWATRARRLATADVNAAVEGALAAGARRVWVKDGHDMGENLLVEDLHPAAELIYGSTAVPGHLPGLDASFDALFIVGFHARMGTYRAQMDHTITTTAVNEVRLSGVTVGEIGIYAAYAGWKQVPVALVTGDLAATREATDLLGEDLHTVAVQEAYGRFSGRLRPLAQARAEIRATAERALRAPRLQPWLPPLPLNAAVDFLRTAEADMAEMVPAARRTGPRTVEFEQEDPGQVFRALQAMVFLGGAAARRWATTIYTTGSRV